MAIYYLIKHKYITTPTSASVPVVDKQWQHNSVTVLACYSETRTKKQDKQTAITGMRFLQNLVRYTRYDSITNTKM